MRGICKLLILCLIFVPFSMVQAEVCAINPTELNKTPRLQQIKSFFGKKENMGLVNQTQGSYIILQAKEDHFFIRFYTSGLFDLYGISKEGPIIFCDSGSKLLMYGLSRKDQLQIFENQVVLGDGGPRMNFELGEMPMLLQKLHHLNSRGVAAAPQ